MQITMQWALECLFDDKQMRAALFAVLISSFAVGCTTLADARKAEGAGVKRDYPAPVQQTWEASKNALAKLKLDVASENRQEGYLLAQRGMTAFSYGENIAIFIRRKSDAVSSVEVVSKKAMATNIFAPDLSEDIHREIQNELRR